MLRFRLFGYPAEISVWFCVVLCVLLLLDSQGSFRWCMVAAALHEVGHLTMMSVLACPKCRIRFTALGIRLERVTTTENSWKQEFFIAIAGPSVNLLVFLILSFGGSWLGDWETVRGAAETQLAVGLLNLLPIYPLDGGQATASLLNLRLSFRMAEIVSNVLSALLLFPLLILGILVLFRSRYNWTLLFFAGYLVFFLILKNR